MPLLFNIYHNSSNSGLYLPYCRRCLYWACIRELFQSFWLYHMLISSHIISHIISHTSRVWMLLFYISTCLQWNQGISWSGWGGTGGWDKDTACFCHLSRGQQHPCPKPGSGTTLYSDQFTLLWKSHLGPSDQKLMFLLLASVSCGQNVFLQEVALYLF